MTSDPRSDAERALAEATRRYGAEILQSPVQTRAIVADLVGDEDGDHRQQLGALYAAVKVLRDPPTERAEAVDKARELASSPDVGWAVDLVAEAREIVLTRERTANGGRRAAFVGGFVILAVAVVVLVVAFFGSAGPSRTVDTKPSTTPTTPTTLPKPEFLADFSPVREADYLVTRRWAAQGDSLRVTVQLDPVVGAAGRPHREALVGTGPIDAIVPAPQIPESGRVVAYESAGTDPFEFSYRLTLPVAASAAELDSLFTEWVPRRDAQISTVDAFEPVPAPTIGTG